MASRRSLCASRVMLAEQSVCRVAPLSASISRILWALSSLALTLWMSNSISCATLAPFCEAPVENSAPAAGVLDGGRCLASVRSCNPHVARHKHAAVCDNAFVPRA